MRFVLLLLILVIACRASVQEAPPVMITHSNAHFDISRLSPTSRARLALPPCINPDQVVRAHRSDSVLPPVLYYTVVMPEPPRRLRPVTVVLRTRLDSLGRMIPSATQVEAPPDARFRERLSTTFSMLRFLPALDLSGTCTVSALYTLTMTAK